MRLVLVTAILMVSAVPAFAQSTEDLLNAATKALRGKQPAEALKLASKAVASDPDSVAALTLRASIYDALDKHAEAAADYRKVLDIVAVTHQARGVAAFKAGKIKESIDEFDRFIALKPDAKISHWQRGISYYYAGRYDDGRTQFEGSQDFDSNDVENAVWRFMCMVRKDGIEKARKDMLKIGNDKRVPMRQVYDLYKGDLKPEDVMKVAKANNELFYAHLYIGIYYDLLGDKKKAFDHLNQATERYRINHYMWDVARVHRDLLAKEQKKE
ncbi:MAG TPA: tetratricopeptide repeat protein [Gemmataceae bacterium]|nr:tetratricopeptide repeat protein [Gemmataceae bacterium]